ncbi:MAG: hypothetical protein LQ350_005430 [Teloschistes chrysophthalmus]|nr:MAG: hypothetical protein LQ350_005430 [Niorma chrysophthalma]
MFRHVEIVEIFNGSKRKYTHISFPLQKAHDYPDDSEKESFASKDITAVMEPLEDYKLKIQSLLNDIAMSDYEAEYILRVAIRVMLGRDNQAIDNELALLNYLKRKIPVPRIKAYSLDLNNPLGAAYSVQTRIPGRSLYNLWYYMTQPEKYQIINKVIKLLRRLETITFPKAGELIAASPPQTTSDDYTETAPPIIRSIFNESDDLIASPQNLGGLGGRKLKRLLTTLLKNWIRAFAAQPFPIVLHHWDLEPRNIIVSFSNPCNTWKITGLIDWDKVQALPLPLARTPPAWVWHFPWRVPIGDGSEYFTGPPLSKTARARRRYFFKEVERVLPGYRKDAWELGRWVRRIHWLTMNGAYREEETRSLDELIGDWAEWLEGEGG